MHNSQNNILVHTQMNEAGIQVLYNQPRCKWLLYLNQLSSQVVSLTKSQAIN